MFLLYLVNYINTKYLVVPKSLLCAVIAVSVIIASNYIDLLMYAIIIISIKF